MTILLHYKQPTKHKVNLEYKVRVLDMFGVIFIIRARYILTQSLHSILQCC